MSAIATVTIWATNGRRRRLPVYRLTSQLVWQALKYDEETGCLNLSLVDVALSCVPDATAEEIRGMPVWDIERLLNLAEGNDGEGEEWKR